MNTALEPVILGPCTLYCGDCMDLLPIEADAVITDPPYGIGKDGQRKTTGGHGGRKAYEFRGWDDARPDAAVFEAILKSAPTVVIWGGNYFADLLPVRGKWLAWDKGQRISQSDGELAWTTGDGALRFYICNRQQLAQDGAVHPTQKPVQLIGWCMTQMKVPISATVLDPYAGSFTTAIACIRTGRKFIGVERDPTHFKTGVERIKRELESPLLNEFHSDAPPNVQHELSIADYRLSR